MQSSITHKNDDIIFFNGSITNNQNQNITLYPVYAAYDEQRSQDILKKPDDYMFSLVRWSIPTTSIPLLIAPILNFVPIPPYATPNFDVNLINFAVCLSWWNGTNFVDYVTFIEYQHQGSVPPPTLPITTSNDEYYYIYSYQQLINLVNDALSHSFNMLKADFTIPSTLAPMFLYDPVTNLYTLQAQNSYQAPNINVSDPTNPDPSIRFGSRNAITIWFGPSLFDNMFSSGFNVDFAGLNNRSQPDPHSGYIFNKTYRLIVQDNGNNVVGGITNMTSEFPVISNSVSFQNIVILSKGLPIVSEGITPAQNVTNTGVSNDIANIVSDYTYDFFSSGNAISGRQGIVYTPSVYRFSNLTSQTPLSRIDLYAQWQDGVGNYHNIDLRQNGTFSFKIMFVRKSFIGNLINSGG